MNKKGGKEGNLDCYVVLSTVSTKKEGERISRMIIREGLAACVNLIPGVKSIYSWKGRVCEEEEVLLVIKTVERRLYEIINKIKVLHSYEIPEILALRVQKGEKSYEDWLRDAVGIKGKKAIDNKKFNR
jgi:periplasmic divalent cation tolerance protein